MKVFTSLFPACRAVGHGLEMGTMRLVNSVKGFMPRTRASVAGAGAELEAGWVGWLYSIALVGTK